MARSYREMGALCILVLLMLVNLGCSDLTKDKQECSNQLIGLATCLPYVGGQAKAPTLDCCTGLKQVLKDSKKCLCILVKDRNDPDLGLQINSTLALGLPQTCHASANIADCPALLHLPPNSPDAKVFTDFNKAAASSSSSSPVSSGKSTGSTNGTSANTKSDGGKGNRLQIAQVIIGVMLLSFSSHFIF